MSIEQKAHAIAFKAAKEAWEQCEGWDADGARLSAACESYHLAYESAKAATTEQPDDCRAAYEAWSKAMCFPLHKSVTRFAGREELAYDDNGRWLAWEASWQSRRSEREVQHPDEVCGIPIVKDPAVPPGEVHFMSCGKLVGKITDVGASSPEREMVTLSAVEKYAIADEIVIECRSKSDVVQDVFDELAERFELRRRNSETSDPEAAS